MKCFCSVFGGHVGLTSWNVVQELVRRKKREWGHVSKA